MWPRAFPGQALELAASEDLPSALAAQIAEVLSASVRVRTLGYPGSESDTDRAPSAAGKRGRSRRLWNLRIALECGFFRIPYAHAYGRTAPGHRIRAIADRGVCATTLRATCVYTYIPAHEVTYVVR